MYGPKSWLSDTAAKIKEGEGETVISDVFESPVLEATGL